MKYFSIKELSLSDTAINKGIDNTPNTTETANLEAVVDNILDPAREALGKPIHVNSGFRCATLNTAIGGVSTSQHTKGEAVDIELGGKTPAENEALFNWIANNCVYDQLINESKFSWVHVSFKREGQNRMQILAIG